MKTMTTNLSLLLDYPSQAVVETVAVEDVTCGMVPCYYIKHGNHLKVSTSAASLIADSGEFDQNGLFTPDYSKMLYWPHLTTVDNRVKRLKAFEVNTVDGSYVAFTPKRWDISPKQFIDSSIIHFEKWIRYFEKYYSSYENIVYTGGLDSRIIWLLQKENPSKWHVFSSEPNGHLVKEWLDRYSIQYGEFFTHTNENDDHVEYLHKKVYFSDYLTSPFHLRWARRIDEITTHFNKKCIIWLGNLGDTFYACRDSLFKQNSYRDYFVHQFRQSPSMQGLYMQMVFNMTNCPIISLYGSPHIWKDLYQYFEPANFDGMDLRPEMGNKIAGRDLDWNFKNPCPPCWQISDDELKPLLNVYISQIKEMM